MAVNRYGVEKYRAAGPLVPQPIAAGRGCQQSFGVTVMVSSPGKARSLIPRFRSISAPMDRLSHGEAAEFPGLSGTNWNSGGTQEFIKLDNAFRGPFQTLFVLRWKNGSTNC
jgi:hypothetical protein